MNRYRRFLSNLLVTISLIVFFLTVTLFFRTQFAADTIIWGSPSNTYSLAAYGVGGDLEIEFLIANPIFGVGRGFHFFPNFYPDIRSFSAPAAPASWWKGWDREILGVRLSHESHTQGTFGHISDTDLIIPLWLIALASAMLPTFALFRYVQHCKHAQRGVCPNCGYDLRATPDRCPECGRVAAVPGSPSELAAPDG